MRLLVFYNDEFAERVVGNLANTSSYCRSCGLTCTYCRQLYGSFAADLHGLYRSPHGLPAFLDDPERYLPKDPPNCDIVLAVGLHPDILAAMPTLTIRAKAKAVIVPQENRTWCPAGLRRQLAASLDDIGVEHVFPKPFCSLDETGKPVIDSFIHRYRIGKPRVEVKTSGNRVAAVQVLQSAPCGSTWYEAQQIKWTRLSDLNAAVAVAHHAFPCTASMDMDPEAGEPILHLGGYAIRDAVNRAVEESLNS